MSNNIVRCDGRTYDQMRQTRFFIDAFGYADASILFELGDTKVLVSISLQPGVPPFLKGQRVGWLNAEYAMLPCATQRRTMRDSSQAQRNARSVEISRLIGRCLRTCVSLELLGERTIVVDCDVLQADGSTRVAAITAASIALEQAIQRWIATKVIEKNIFKYHIAAISAGIMNDAAILDLNYEEDSRVDADINFIMTQDGRIIEIQGTSEKKPISWGQLEQLKNLATKGLAHFFLQKAEQQALPNLSPIKSIQKPALFSLGNRIQKNI
jgi:ribonuclease PH